VSSSSRIGRYEILRPLGRGAVGVVYLARDPQIEITLSLITPYVAYWLPEHFGGSGVIATVACGLYMSWNGPLLISAATRLQGIFFWDLVIYLVEGLLFLLTGFQMRLLFEKSKAFPLGDILVATALVAVIVIIARFAWVYPATYLPRLINPRLRARDPMPSWRTVFVIAFTGVRGAVSLAAALALPFALPGGEAFPYREYSEVHFGGGYKVLRGGAWATRPIAVRNTFRNWDHPQRRQIFAGFRCAADG
jgi:NhaP-type Na+/H+ or K+/H+ antiporter